MDMTSTVSRRIINRVALKSDSPLRQYYPGLQYYPGMEVDVVASFGAVGDWAAYIGPRGTSDEDIRDNGLKLNRNEAAPLFPYMNAECYRP